MRIFACMASSLDGRIGPANVDQFVAITSRNDMQHLMRLRDEADGVLFGAGTFRTWPKAHKGLDGSRILKHFILSNSLDLDINTPLFQNPEIPIYIFSSSPEAVSEKRFPANVELVITPTGTDQLPFILKHAKKNGVQSLLVEGGGRVLQQLIESQLLQELYLTLAPKLFGQVDAPGLLGDVSLSNSPQIKLLSSHQLEGETYLHLEFKYI